MVRKMSLALVSIAALSLPSAARADVAVDENNVTAKRDCKGADAVVNGNSNTLTFANCPKVTVMGNKNRIDTGDATVVAVLGNDNVVTWHASPDGTPPRVSNPGSRNTVSGAKPSGETRKPSGEAKPARADTGPETFVVNDNGQRITHDCQKGKAVVNGDQNFLVFRNCARVEVKGNGNSVDAGAPTALFVPGNRNEVTWQEALGGTSISNLGTGNRVTRK